MALQYIQVPPDSTGKKVAHSVEIIVNYDNGTAAFTVGETVVFQTSQLNGVITEVEGNVSTGTLNIRLGTESTETTVDGENIQVGGVTYATLNGTPEKFYIPYTFLVGGNRPSNALDIDRYGSLQVRSSQGDLQLGSTGRLKTSQELIIGEYNFSRFTNFPVVSTSTSGAGASVTDSTYGANKYSVSNSPGDYVKRRTDVYHIVQPNYPVNVAIQLQHGDVGKANNRRRWGYFDDNNGAFFELDGTDLYVVFRSNNTGSVVDTRIAQVNWNADRLDGSGGLRNRTEVTIDITKINYYWIALSQSSCIVNWGIRTEQRNITCHSYCWTNKQTRPVFKNWSLPISWELENTGSALSTSEMWVVYGVVVAETRAWQAYRNPRTISTASRTVSGAWSPILSIRASETDGFGGPNRTWIIPHKLNILSVASPVEYRIRSTLDVAVLGATWTAQGTDGVDVDTVATSATGGIFVYSGFAGSGSAKVDEVVSSNNLLPTTFKLTRRADVTANTFALVLEARTLDGGSTNVNTSLVVFEVQEI